MRTELLQPAWRAPAALALCLSGGAAFSALGTPLPWMLGPLVATAGARMLGLPVERPRGGLPVGQLVIGAALGLYFTAPVLQQVLRFTHFIVAAALFAFVAGTCCALVLRRLSGCDFRTAFFASLPGGAAEMSQLADRVGGRADWVAAAQALRVLIVVLTVPPLIVWSGAHGAEIWSPAASTVDYKGLAAMAVIAFGSGLALRMLDTPNAWLIGPLLAMTVVTGAGIELSAVPRWLLDAAQLLIGCTLGSRFNPEFFHSAPRLVGSVAVTVLLGMALAAVFAFALTSVSTIEFPTAILATAPGGVAEMSITAKLLQLGVPVVTAFHVSRMAFLVLTAAPIFALMQRLLGNTAARAAKR